MVNYPQFFKSFYSVSLGSIWSLVVLAFPLQAFAHPSSQPTTQTHRPRIQKRTKSASAQATLDPGAQLRKRVIEVRLKNGMLFLLVQRKISPTFSAYIRVRAGGVDEKNGLTGLAHIFEHMAFKGTRIVGSRNWKKEKEILHRIARVGDALSEAQVRSRGRETPAIRILKKSLKNLQKEHKKYVQTSEFTRIYDANGGVGLNATTGKDLTSYFLSLPSNRLELWARQESSRLIAPVFREFYKERAVVAEERRMAMSKGSGRLFEQFMATAFVAHPYRLPTVGWMSDITTIPLSAVRAFFKKYYSPSNMVGTIVGDIDIQATRTLLRKTFGRIPSGAAPPPVRTVEPKQTGERRVRVHFHTSPQVLIGYHKPTAPHAHDDVFDVIESLLTQGPSSRLYRALVQKRFAQSIWASSLPGSRFPNIFTLGATPIAPHTTKTIEDIIYKELERLKTELVSTKELQKVRNSIAMSFLRGLRSNNGLASQLSYFQSITGDWRYATRHNERLQRITPQLIRRVARLYFKRSNRTVATLVQTRPKASKGAFWGHSRRATQTKKSPQARYRSLVLRFRRLLQMLRSFRKKKPTPALRAQYKKLMLQARTLAMSIRTLKKKLTQARKVRGAKKKKKQSASSPGQTARVARAIRTALNRIQNVSIQLGSLPKELQAHPATLKYKTLTFTPPKPTIVKLKNGLTLYLLEDKELPLIDFFVLVKTGRVYDPKGKVGLGEMTGRVMRTGGFGSLTGRQLDEALAFRAARLESRINAEDGFAHLSIHRKDLKWGLHKLSGMLRTPRFPKNKINLQRVRMMERIRRYNDQPFRLAIHQFRKLVYGAKHRRAQRPTPLSVISIKRPDLVAFHQKYYHPNNMHMAIVGDFSTAQLLKQLRSVFGAHVWKAKKTHYPTLQALPQKTKPAFVFIEKPIPQSVIIVGHLGPQRLDPQMISGKVMNHILGGGGFSSRLMTEIRTRRGLAYFAASQLMGGTKKGLFAAYTGTRVSKTGQALKTLLGLLKEMAHKGQVTPNELRLAKQTFLNRFVFRFRSPAQIVYRTAYYDYLNYPKNYLQLYKKKLSQLQQKDIQSAAKRFLKPEQFIVLVIGQRKKLDIPLEKLGPFRTIKID